MQLRNYVIRNENGDIVPNGIIEVFEEGTSTPVATVYDASGNPTTNPFTADIYGQYGIRMPNGTYTIAVKANIADPAQTQTVQFMEITNVDEINTVSNNIDDVIFITDNFETLTVIVDNIDDITSAPQYANEAKESANLAKKYSINNNMLYWLGA